MNATKAFGVMVTAAILLFVIAPRDSDAQPATSQPATQASAGKADPKAKAVLARFVDATGGRAAYEAVRSRDLTATIQIVNQNITGTVVARVAPPDRVSQVTELAGMGQTEQGLNGDVGWERSATYGARLLSSAEVEQLRFQANADRVALNPEAFFSEIEYAGEGTVDGKAVDNLTLTGKGGKVTQSYDKATGLLIQTSVLANTPQGPGQIVTVLDDYKVVGGLTIAHRQVTTFGPEKMVTTITDLKINSELSPEAFRVPEDVRKILSEKK